MTTPYARNRDTGRLEVAPPRAEYGTPTLPPQGNGGLYSTPLDYSRFCRMLLNRGTLDGRRYLGEKGMQAVSTVQTGDLPTGFFQSDAAGGYGANYGWGLGTCVLRSPHPGVAAMLSPGTFGHGGAWGTQAWVDPVRGVAYVLMVQRANFPNSDGSDVRRDFQAAAAASLFPDTKPAR
jgi:CubicO group peptidase (beta-lactamase class C family)